MNRFLQTLGAVAAAAGLLLMFAPAVYAQKYPSRPVKLIVPVPPGSGTDLITSRASSSGSSPRRTWHVPYKGNAPAVTDLLGGQVHMMFDIITTSLPHIRAGRLKGLAVTSAKRSSLSPELPTMIEAGLPGFETTGWYMMLAPAGLPKDVMATLNAEVNKAMKDPEVGETLGSQGVEWVGGTPEQALDGGYIRSEIRKWAKVEETSGAKPEG